MFNLPNAYSKKQEEYYLKYSPKKDKFDCFIFEYALRTSENTKKSFFDRYEHLLNVYNNQLYSDVMNELGGQFSSFAMQYAFVIQQNCLERFILNEKHSEELKKFFSQVDKWNDFKNGSEKIECDEWIFLAIYFEIIVKIKKEIQTFILFDEYCFNKLLNFMITNEISVVIKKYNELLSYRNCIVKISDKKSYFFDEDGIYSCTIVSDNRIINLYSFFLKWKLSKYFEYNKKVLKEAISKMEVGMSISDFEQIYRSIKLGQKLVEVLKKQEIQEIKSPKVEKPKKKEIKELKSNTVKIPKTNDDKKLKQDKNNVKTLNQFIRILNPKFKFRTDNYNKKIVEFIIVDVKICDNSLNENLEIFEKTWREQIIKLVEMKLKTWNELEKYGISSKNVNISRIEYNNSTSMIYYFISV